MGICDLPSPKNNSATYPYPNNNLMYYNPPNSYHLYNNGDYTNNPEYQIKVINKEKEGYQRNNLLIEDGKDKIIIIKKIDINNKEKTKSINPVEQNEIKTEKREPIKPVTEQNNMNSEKESYIKKINELNNENNQIKGEKLSYINKINELNNENNQIKGEKVSYINKINELNNENNQIKGEKQLYINKIDQKEKEIIILKEQTEPILVGLNNIGATCYMNATLQSLSNTPRLTDYFLKKYKYIPGDKSKIMSNEYLIVIKNLWHRENHKKSFSPNSFKNVLSQLNPLFQGIAANDSKDLINFLLERFHQELNTINQQEEILRNSAYINQADQLDEQKMLNLFLNDFNIKFHSIISDLFYGVMETKSQCQGCNNIKYNFQVYSFLEFPLEQVNKYCFNKGLRNNYLNTNINPDVDLYECFNYYSNMEMMTGENQMYCNICKRSCDAFYGTNLYSAPNYLIINLNRGKGAVYQCNVIFPEKLNILNFVSYQEGNTYFELYAVICHIGPSSMSGHFVAYCKDKIDKKWYLFNDSSVTPCKKKDEYKNGMPYILFYQAL